MIRSGALRLVFDRMVLPDGTVRFTNTSLTSIDYKGVKTDSEGTVRPRLSKKRLLVQVGGALLIALVSRALMSVADLLFAGGAVLAERRHGRGPAGVVDIARR